MSYQVGNPEDRFSRDEADTRVSTNPTDPVFCADPATFIAFQKKIKRFSYLPTLKYFRKLDKKL